MTVAGEQQRITGVLSEQHDARAVGGGGILLLSVLPDRRPRVAASKKVGRSGCLRNRGLVIAAEHVGPHCAELVEAFERWAEEREFESSVKRCDGQVAAVRDHDCLALPALVLVPGQSTCREQLRQRIALLRSQKIRRGWQRSQIVESFVLVRGAIVVVVIPQKVRRAVGASPKTCGGVTASTFLTPREPHKLRPTVEPDIVDAQKRLRSREKFEDSKDVIVVDVGDNEQLHIERLDFALTTCSLDTMTQSGDSVPHPSVDDDDACGPRRAVLEPQTIAASGGQHLKFQHGCPPSSQSPSPKPTMPITPG